VPFYFLVIYFYVFYVCEHDVGTLDSTSVFCVFGVGTSHKTS